MTAPGAVLMWNSTALAARSAAHPETLFIDISDSTLARGGFTIRVTTTAARIALVLVARHGSVIPKAEMIELLYGDREDGGPAAVDQSIENNWMVARAALAALGYSVERIINRGFVARPLAFGKAA